MKALILTGRIISGHDEKQAWAKIAALFKLEPEAFSTRIIARTPLSIRETADDAELQRMASTLQAYGGEVQQIESDGSKWFLQQADRVSGPVPLAFLKSKYDVGQLAGDTNVKQVTDKEWTTLATALDVHEIVLDVPPSLEQYATDDEPPPLPNNLFGKPVSAESKTNFKQEGSTPQFPNSNIGRENWFDLDENPTIQNWLIVISILIIGTILFLTWKASISGLVLSVIVAASAVWIYLDATRNHIGKIPGESGMFNMSAGAWAAAELLLWIVGFPAYLIKRSTLLKKARNSPVSVTGVSSKTMLIGGLGALWVVVSLYMYGAGTLPNCDSQDTIKLVEKLIRDNLAVKAAGIKINSINMSAEVKYDASAQKRVCRAIVSTERGEEPISYSVEWHDQAKGYFWVQIIQ